MPDRSILTSLQNWKQMSSLRKLIITLEFKSIPGCWNWLMNVQNLDCEKSDHLTMTWLFLLCRCDDNSKEWVGESRPLIVRISLRLLIPAEGSFGLFSSRAVNYLVLWCSDAFRCYSFAIVCHSCPLSPMRGDDFFLFYISLSIRISREEKKGWSDSSETTEHWSMNPRRRSACPHWWPACLLSVLDTPTHSLLLLQHVEACVHWIFDHR